MSDDEKHSVAEVENGLRQLTIVARSFQTTEREFGIFCGGLVNGLMLAEEINKYDVKVHLEDQPAPSVVEFHLMMSKGAKTVMELFLAWKRQYEMRQAEYGGFPVVLASMDEIYDTIMREQYVKKDDDETPQGLPS